MKNCTICCHLEKGPNTTLIISLTVLLAATHLNCNNIMFETHAGFCLFNVCFISLFKLFVICNLVFQLHSLHKCLLRKSLTECSAEIVYVLLNCSLFLVGFLLVLPHTYIKNVNSDVVTLSTISAVNTEVKTISA